MDYGEQVFDQQNQDGGDGLEAIGTPAPGPVGKPDAAADTPEKVKAFVKGWIDRIKSAKKHHEKAWKRMRECEDLALNGAEEKWLEGGNYVVPIVNRLINVAVAQLYARNPTALSKRRERLMSTAWDGTAETLQDAEKLMMSNPLMPDPQAMAIVNDAESVKAYDQMMDRVAKTLTILHKHYLTDPTEQYKEQFKSLVRRVKVVGVGYAKLNFQRIMEKNPDISLKIDETAQQIATIQRDLTQYADGELQDDDAKMEELRATIEALQSQETVIVKEGPFYSFPRWDKIIVDPACKQLKTLLGANWVAEEMEMTPGDVMENWKDEDGKPLDIAGNYSPYKTTDTDWARWEETSDSVRKSDTALVYRVQNRKMGVEFVICEGYPGYLQPPAPPKIKIPRFFDIFPLVFNDHEHRHELYPFSDVWNVRHLQNEYNRSREFLREHRQQNRPAYVTPKGTFEEKDLGRLRDHQSGEILELDGLLPEAKIGDKLQAKPVMQIDPKQYEVDSIYTDMLRVTGNQTADIGSPQDSTATESSIAEQNRETQNSDPRDALDEFLSLLAHATGVVMLAELSQPTVQAIVGPGAAWPELPQSREDIAEELSLTTRAAASGKPNAPAKIANLERIMPFLMQIPGVNMTIVLEYLADWMEIPFEDFIVEGLPSMQTINTMMQQAQQAALAAQTAPAGGAPPGAAGGPPGSPEAQGAHGANNAPAPPGQAPGPQPGHPPPRVIQFDHQGNPAGGHQPQMGPTQ